MSIDTPMSWDELCAEMVRQRTRAEAAEAARDKAECAAFDTAAAYLAAQVKLNALREAVENALRQTRNTKCIRLLEPALAKSKE